MDLTLDDVVGLVPVCGINDETVCNDGCPGIVVVDNAAAAVMVECLLCDVDMCEDALSVGTPDDFECNVDGKYDSLVEDVCIIALGSMVEKIIVCLEGFGLWVVVTGIWVDVI